MKTKLIGLTVLALATLQIGGQQFSYEPDAIAKMKGSNIWIAPPSVLISIANIKSEILTNWTDVLIAPSITSQMAYLQSNRWATVVVEGVTNRFLVSSAVMQTPVLMLRDEPAENPLRWYIQTSFIHTNIWITNGFPLRDGATPR